MKLTTNLRMMTFATLCLLALTPTALFAANPRSQEERGTIKSVDAAAHTLVVADLKDNKEHKFLWNDQSKFSERGKTVTAADLKAGKRIRVTYKGSGEMPAIEHARLAPAKTGKSASEKS